MARVILTAGLVAGWFIVGAGLLFSSFDDWTIYAYGILGGIGFALVSERSLRRRRGEPES